MHGNAKNMVLAAALAALSTMAAPLSAAAEAEEPEFFYYYFDEVRYLSLCPYRVTVKFEEGLSEAEQADILMGEPALDPAGEWWFGDGPDVDVIGVKPGVTGWTIVETLDRLYAADGVYYATPIFGQAGDALIDDIFIVSVPNTTTYESVAAFNAKHSVEVVKTYDFGLIGKTLYLMRVTKASGMNALLMCNVYHDTDELDVSGSGPNFWFLYNILCGGDYASEELHLYHQAGRRTLALVASLERAAVCFESALTNAEKEVILATEPVLAPSTEWWRVEGEAFEIVGVVAGAAENDLFDALDRLHAVEGVVFATPIVQSKEGFESVITDAFYVECSTATDLEALNAEHSVILTETVIPGADRVGYWLQVTKASGMNALEMAIVYDDALDAFRASPELIPLYGKKAEQACCPFGCAAATVGAPERSMRPGVAFFACVASLLALLTVLQRRSPTP